MGLREDIIESEKKYQKAIAFKYRNLDQKVRDDLVSNDPVGKIDILNFYDIYRKIHLNSSCKLNKLCLLLLDIKIEMFYIFTDLAASNKFFISSDKNTYFKFSLLSYDQSLIVKSRILWERVMNFIYFLEKDKELPSKTSKKSEFFKFIEGTHWDFLLDYKEYIDWFDENLRTPEVHQGSCLRKYFISAEEFSNEERNKVLVLINIVQNTIYSNVLSIIQGQGATIKYWYQVMGKNPYK